MHATDTKIIPFSPQIAPPPDTGIIPPPQRTPESGPKAAPPTAARTLQYPASMHYQAARILANPSAYGVSVHHVEALAVAAADRRGARVLLAPTVGVYLVADVPEAARLAAAGLSVAYRALAL